MRFWAFAFFLSVLVGCGGETTVSPKRAELDNRPNVILIMADDQGWGDLSYHGNTNLSTPNIDALAKNGVSFTNFYVQPVCSPTRAELLTGKFFTRLGVHGTSAGGERMNSGVPTLADKLKKVGYRTAAFGKWHNGMQPPYHPNARGFEEYYGFASGHWGNYFSPMLEHNGKIVQGEGFLIDDLTNHSISFIDKHKDEPFFVYLPLNTPHSPMQVPDPYWEKFKNKELTMTYQQANEEDPEFTKAALAMVENIDWNVGRLMKKVQDLGLQEETIVIYLSDNGPNSWRWNGGLRGRKGSTDEGGVKTPFFIEWKGHLTPGIKIDKIGSALDIAPTLLSLLDVETEEDEYDGLDLSPLLIEPEKAWADRIIYNHWGGRTSLRTQQYRLDDQNRLYDMVGDSGQLQDIGSSFPQLRDSLVFAKEVWLNEHPPLTQNTDDRPFTLGHPNFKITQIPARDGIPHGSIKRSNIHPNNTFFTNWITEKDSISWNVDVLKEGNYNVTVYYTLPQDAQGTILHLQQGKNILSKRITLSHDPPLKGMENDRVPRMESYVKQFIPLTLGNITLDKGRQPLVLKATDLKNDKGPDIRLLLFERQD